jgi:hypothetical protein
MQLIQMQRAAGKRLPGQPRHQILSAAYIGQLPLTPKSSGSSLSATVLFLHFSFIVLFGVLCERIFH